jgi:hypothetical protein
MNNPRLRSLADAVITVSLKAVGDSRTAWAVNVRCSAVGYLPQSEQFGVIVGEGELPDDITSGS